MRQTIPKIGCPFAVEQTLTLFMDTQPSNNQNNKSKNGCLAPALYWGALFVLFVIAKLIAEDDKSLAKNVFIVGIVAWFLWPFLSSLVGKTFKETKGNVVGFTYLVGLIVAGLVVLGVVSLVLPSSCTSNNTSAPTDMYYRK
jgi:hypothetical protein